MNKDNSQNICTELGKTTKIKKRANTTLTLFSLPNKKNRKKKDEIGRAIETKEVDFSRKLEEVERVIMDFNTAARNAQLIPSNAKYAKGVNFMLQFNAYSPEDTAEHIKTVVKV